MVRKYSGNWKSFSVFTLVVSLIVGYFSVLSDNLPYMGNGVTVSEFIVSYFAVMINSLPMWFIYAMVAGGLFGRNLKQGVIFGTVYTVFAISVYFVMSNILIISEGTVVGETQISTYMIWFAASLVGGSVGGGVGFLVKRNAFALLVVPAGLLLQLFINGPPSWRDIVGIAQNVTYCVMIVGIFALIAINATKNRNSVTS
ncbi:hypothetical protein [Pseudalkalibacillus caeni]|uniref:Uncharacterized protein n=1 Tax=Exobacillus caeni TaxID=2574798 RepID=A0A5R9F2G0_9BACL|nr:hypothetical protein [Pseudalkalibacillus caeni]TLS36506.1 hypothetical protein FCL54_14935 [Pseudalkalibacillus caeni]